MKSQRSNRSDWWSRYRAYLKSPEWKAKRQRLYRDRKGRCEDCYKKLGKRFHAHHESYERVGDEDLDDLRLLCTKCHQKRHPNKNITRKKKPHIKRLVFAFALLVLLVLVLPAILVF
jgi:5-methylcytosine-specific restriction endonuclease McrA